jgi:hypothetical protein
MEILLNGKVRACVKHGAYCQQFPEKQVLASNLITVNPPTTIEAKLR